MMKNLLSPLFSKKNPFLALGFLAIFALIGGGCADHNTPTKPPKEAASKFGYGGTNVDDAFVASEQTPPTTTTVDSSAITPPSTATTNATAASNPFLSPTPAPAVVSHDLPYGTPVAGKPGFVTSPHSPTAGYVDVRGFPPGTEVKDPYSGKVFLVP